MNSDDQDEAMTNLDTQSDISVQNDEKVSITEIKTEKQIQE